MFKWLFSYTLLLIRSSDISYIRCPLLNFCSVLREQRASGFLNLFSLSRYGRKNLLLISWFTSVLFRSFEVGINELSNSLSKGFRYFTFSILYIGVSLWFSPLAIILVKYIVMGRTCTGYVNLLLLFLYKRNLT